MQKAAILLYKLLCSAGSEASLDNSSFVFVHHKYISSCPPQVVYRANEPYNKPTLDQSEKCEIRTKSWRKEIAQRKGFIC